jgi:hypothetical protein
MADEGAAAGSEDPVVVPWAPPGAWAHTATALVVTAIVGPVVVALAAYVYLAAQPFVLLVGLLVWPHLIMIDRHFVDRARGWLRTGWVALSYWLVLPLGALLFGGFGSSGDITAAVLLICTPSALAVAGLTLLSRVVRSRR